MADQHRSDPAAGRFFIMQIFRIAGMAVAVYGLLVVASAEVPWPDVLPRWLGIVLVLIGLTDALLVPRIMARAWSTEGLRRREEAVRAKDDTDR